MGGISAGTDSLLERLYLWMWNLDERTVICAPGQARHLLLLLLVKIVCKLCTHAVVHKKPDRNRNELSNNSCCGGGHGGAMKLSTLRVHALPLPNTRKFMHVCRVRTVRGNGGTRRFRNVLAMGPPKTMFCRGLHVTYHIPRDV